MYMAAFLNLYEAELTLAMSPKKSGSLKDPDHMRYGESVAPYSAGLGAGPLELRTVLVLSFLSSSYRNKSTRAPVGDNCA